MKKNPIIKNRLAIEYYIQRYLFWMVRVLIQKKKSSNIKFEGVLRTEMGKCLGILLFVLGISLISEAYAQSEALFPNFSLSSKSDTSKSGPAIITANTMDFDLNNNLVVLTGDVAVNDKTTEIKSEKLTVYLTKSHQSDSNANAAIPSSSKIQKIIATNHVVIIKKQNQTIQGIAPQQKATAGKAEYDLLSKTIVLTEDPKIYQGESYVSGEKITLWRDSNKVKVEGNQSSGEVSKMMIRPEDQKE